MIVFGRLTKLIYENKDYFVYQFRKTGGEHIVATYKGENPPKARKTVDLQISADYKKTKYGKTYSIKEWRRSDVKVIDYKVKGIGR